MTGNVCGVASIGAGAAAALLSFAPTLEAAAVPICAAGALVGASGFALLLIGRRRDVKLPLIGMTLCAASALFHVGVQAVLPEKRSPTGNPDAIRYVAS